MQEGRDKIMNIMSLGFYYEDLVLPFGAAIVVVCLAIAAYIHWRF